MKNILFLLFQTSFLFVNTSLWAQESKPLCLSQNEKIYYQNIKALAMYAVETEKSGISRDTLFEKYIEFDYVLNDTLMTRKQQRLAYFDNLFDIFRRKIDSMGIENLDAKPLRFYQNHDIYKPFKKGLSKSEPQVLVYFKKENPKNPLGTLLFDLNMKKLLAWIFLRQGENEGFYLTFDLLGNVIQEN
ncbi:hypothetical protein [Spongiimicrobium sp. 3-5]|uniref:hypothetical protein n=1 Tax=Spongiimicrobium sp. 3-5 TaxID=3332596 RepID=UPI00397F710D